LEHWIIEREPVSGRRYHFCSLFHTFNPGCFSDSVLVFIAYIGGGRAVNLLSARPAFLEFLQFYDGQSADELSTVSHIAIYILKGVTT